MTSLQFKPGDWVKVVKKPKGVCSLLKGDVVQVEQVSPSRQMIRIVNPDTGWDYLNFSEVELTLPPNQNVVTERQNRRHGTTENSEVPTLLEVLDKIKAILEEIPVSSRDDIVYEILSWRDDKASDRRTSWRNDKPRIVWRSPAGREDQYPWLECRYDRAYIGGGRRESKAAQQRVAIVRNWIEKEILPLDEILHRIRTKQFNVETTAESSPTQNDDKISDNRRDRS